MLNLKLAYPPISLRANILNRAYWMCSTALLANSASFRYRGAR